MPVRHPEATERLFRLGVTNDAHEAFLFRNIIEQWSQVTQMSHGKRRIQQLPLLVVTNAYK
jgi:hypothetical protein